MTIEDIEPEEISFHDKIKQARKLIREAMVLLIDSDDEDEDVSATDRIKDLAEALRYLRD